MEGSHRPDVLGAITSALTENLGLKLAALLIALALFGMVRGAGTVQRSIEVSLVARLPPPAEHRVLLTDLPDKVRVTVRGSPSLVGTLRSDELGPVQIDLSDGNRRWVIFDPSLFTLPGGVQVEQVQPASLQLSWDNLVERIVRIRPTFFGSPARGTRLAADAEVTPANITVRGPDGYLDSLVAIPTQAIDISGLGPGHDERSVTLEAPRAHVQYASSVPVTVAFNIERELVDRRIGHVPVTVPGGAAVQIQPAAVAVVLRGPPGAINTIDPHALQATVDVPEPAALAHGAVRAAVHPPAQLATDVTVVSIDPEEVTVSPSR